MENLKIVYTLKGYRIDHLMYLRNEDLIKATDNIRAFIANHLLL
ncbi:hypothetical protein [Aquimarina megaterium]|nr:hypothetical protein [Aquimarina megaterium]